MAASGKNDGAGPIFRARKLRFRSTGPILRDIEAFEQV